MTRTLALLALCATLTGIGVVGGWYAARQGSSPGGEAGEEGHAGSATAPSFDDRTLANLGVTIAPAEKSTFVRFRPVQAVVVDRPENLQPAVSHLGGIVTAVHIEVGGTASADAPLVTIARDPIPRPKPDLTADLLTPISEEVHEAASALRSAVGRLAIVDRNLARVREAAAGSNGDGLPVFRKSVIELENERSAVLLDVQSAQVELTRHGLSTEEIAAVEAGRDVPANPRLWQHALQRHGLWPASAEAIHAALPEATRGLPWAVAAIGELVAAGLADDILAEAMKARSFANRFAEAAGLLLGGTPLGTVRLLADAGALEPEFAVRAPDGLPLWDVIAVTARIGRRVEPGEELVVLHDARRMWLRLDPVGEEIGHVVRALADSAALEAVPLVPDSGPRLQGLRLSRLETRATGDDRGGRAYAIVENTRLCPADAVENSACSWGLREGLRYLVRVPVEHWENRFVLPATALADDGPSRVVFLRDGDAFRAQKVRVEYEDDEVAVLADDGGIFEGDPLVMTGAFTLSLALSTGDTAVDPHAGHNH